MWPRWFLLTSEVKDFQWERDAYASYILLSILMFAYLHTQTKYVISEYISHSPNKTRKSDSGNMEWLTVRTPAPASSVSAPAGFLCVAQSRSTPDSSAGLDWDRTGVHQCVAVEGCKNRTQRWTMCLIIFTYPLKQLHRQCFPGNAGVDVTNKRVQTL